MAFSAGMYFENGSGNIVFAEHNNSILNAQRSNYVIDTSANGGEVTANGSSDLTTTQADIDIADVDTFNNATINNLTGITSIDLSEAYDDLSAGQSLYVLIYIKANGTISDPSDSGGNEGVGTPATTGQQLPPAIIENSVPLALITLTNGDTTVDAADIEDYRIEGPQGGYFNGAFRVVESGITAFDINETTGHIGIGTVSNSNYGVFIDAPAEQIGANQSFDRVRIDDQGAITVQTATTSDLVTTLHIMEPNIVLTGTGAVTTATTVYVGGPPTEATNNYSILSDAGDIRFDASQVIFNDENDGDETLFNLDLLNRTLDIGNATNSVATNHYGNFIFGYLTGDSSEMLTFTPSTGNNYNIYADTSEKLIITRGGTGGAEIEISDNLVKLATADLNLSSQVLTWDLAAGQDILEIPADNTYLRWGQSDSAQSQIPDSSGVEARFNSGANRVVYMYNAGAGNFELNIDGKLNVNSNEVINATNHVFTIPLYPNVRLTGGWAFSSTDQYISTGSAGTSYCYVPTPDTITSIEVAGTENATTWTVKLQYSDNGGTWTDVGGGWTQTDQPFPNTLSDTFTPQADRQYRLLFTCSGGLESMSIRGIEVNY